MNRVFGLALISLSAAFSVAAAELHPCGYVEEDLRVTAAEHQVFSIPAAPNAPFCSDVSYVDLSDELPPVGNQGGIGSCTSWGVAYYHRTQLEYRERRWDLTDPRHQFSPSFCYNQVNGGQDGGSGFKNNMSLIMQQGCASLADCPYGASYTSWPSESAYSRALPFRVKSWHWFRTEDTVGINMVKQLLVNGSTVPIAIHVWGNFDNISRYNYTYCASERTGDRRGGHVVTILGYDDTLPTADGTGAFKLINSWGRNWGKAGFFWMSYEAVTDSFLSQRSAAFMVDTTGYEPKLLARVKIDHQTRDRVGIDFMVGPRTNPLWYRSWRTWRRARVDRPFPDNKMVFDLTEAANFIEDLTTDSIYLVCFDDRPDGREGTIDHMSGQYLPWGNIFTSTHTPVDIPDNGGAACAGTRLEQYDRDVASHLIDAPVGIVTPDSQYIPVARVWNFGRNTASFPVILSIGSGYLDTVLVSGLQPTDSAHVRFRTWDAPSRGGFGVRCSTALAGDEYSGNDLVTDSVHLRLHDIAVLEIVCPVDTVDSGAV
ncbi:MAG: C1 family peptidase, partial [candidate division WOR-3 bacterium]